MSYLLDTSFSGLAAGANIGTDYRAALQSALNSATSQGKGLLVTQPYGASLNSNGNVLEMPSNSFIKFAGNGCIKLLPHSATDYAMLMIDGKTNVNIFNPRLDGSKENNSASGGEYGMGISMYNASNVIITKPQIIDTWGDGIYIGGDGTPNTNIEIWNPYIADVRRNCISVISANGLKIWNAELTRAMDTNPKCGIDFEPNNNSNVLQNIDLYSPKTIGCNLGLEFALQGLVGANPQNVSINVWNWEDINSRDTALSRYDLNKGSYSVTGRVKFRQVWYVKSNIIKDFAAPYDNSVVWDMLNEVNIS